MSNTMVNVNILLGKQQQDLIHDEYSRQQCRTRIDKDNNANKININNNNGNVNSKNKKAAITAEQLLFTEKHYECINGLKGKSNERLKNEQREKTKQKKKEKTERKKNRILKENRR